MDNLEAEIDRVVATIKLPVALNTFDLRSFYSKVSRSGRVTDRISHGLVSAAPARVLPVFLFFLAPSFFSQTRFSTLLRV